MNLVIIYPTKGQRLEQERRKLIKIPRTAEDAKKNRVIQERIKKIQEVF